MDVTIQAQVMNLIKELKEKLGTSMILITHDLGIVAQICDKVAIMYAGQVVEYAEVKKIYENPSHPYTVGLFNSIPKLDNRRGMAGRDPRTAPEPTERSRAVLLVRGVLTVWRSVNIRNRGSHM